MQNISLQVQITKIATRSDNSLAVSIETPELPTEEMAVLFKLKKIGICYAAFAFEDMSDEEISMLSKSKNKLNSKSEAQRMRLKIYDKFVAEKDSHGFDTFESYYHYVMTRLMVLIDSGDI